MRQIGAKLYNKVGGNVGENVEGQNGGQSRIITFSVAVAKKKVKHIATSTVFSG